MSAEIQAFQKHIWDLLPLPKDKVVIDYKWVYKVKFQANDIERFKSRLVAKGHNQQECLDYNKTFSLVAKIAIVKTVLSLAARSSYQIQQFDVYNAFLRGDLHDEVYIELSHDFSSQGEPSSNLICRLMESLYVLKQASSQWNLKLFEYFLKYVFLQSNLDPSLFIKRTNCVIIVILMYVDDMWVTSNNRQLIVDTRKSLHRAFRIKQLGDLKFFLGMEFSRSTKWILVNQRKYPLKILSELRLGTAKLAWTPLNPNVKLTTQAPANI